MAEKWKGPEKWAMEEADGQAWLDPADIFRAAMEQVRKRMEATMHEAYGCPPECPCALNLDTGEVLTSENDPA